ncbi:acetyltransferase [Bacteroidia bacterium]|nr:acetyltransferase [Bacteroidia bacterium]
MLQNDVILLRALEPEDLEYLYRWENDIELWDVSETLTPFSRFTLKEYIANAHRDIYENKQLQLTIVRKEDMQPIGSVELFDFDPFHLRAGVGIMLHSKETRKQGYAKSAVELILYYVFDVLALHQLYCYIPSSNTASLNLFDNMGFERSGCNKQWLKRGDSWEDVFLLQLLAENWKKCSPCGTAPAGRADLREGHGLQSRASRNIEYGT